MTHMKKYLSAALFFSCLLFMVSCSGEKPKEPNPYENAKIEVKTFQVDSTGWGYDIYLHGGKYVHQPQIPAINGNRAFNTEEDAKKAGELVAHKIRNNIMPPSVTVQELDSLGVLKEN